MMDLRAEQLIVRNSFADTDAHEVSPNNDQQSLMDWTEWKAQLEGLSEENEVKR